MHTLYVLTIIVALVTLAVCQSPADLEKFHKACMDEAKVTNEELKKFFQNGMKYDAAKENIKCHTKCLMQKHGVWKNGAFDAEAKAKELMQIPKLKEHEVQIKQALSNCKNEKGANECDTAFKITMCLKEFKAQID